MDKENPVKIAIVGKYTGLHDSYLSIMKALEHGAIHSNKKLELIWIDSSDLEGTDEKDLEKRNKAWEEIKEADGILVPGGFGLRGALGMVEAIKYARENKIPYFGICLGMQLAVIEFCRNVLHIEDADTEEYKKQKDNVIIFMPEINIEQKGGTMRLGGRTTDIEKDTLAYKIYYNKEQTKERHRHRYEVNTHFKTQIEDKGFKFSGQDITKDRMEIIEIPDHPFFVGTQFHPEFTSRPFKPNPVFYAFVLAASGQGSLIGTISEFQAKFEGVKDDDSSYSLGE